jgi:hypothetical protein
MASQQTVPQDDTNQLSPHINIPVIEGFQSKLTEIIHNLPDGTKESQWHRWELDRETGVYTAHIVDDYRFPSGLIIQPPPTHLSIINEQFANIKKNMPRWIYDDIGNPVEVARWMLENERARGKHLDVSSAATFCYSRSVIALAELGRPDHVQVKPENFEQSDGTGSFLAYTAGNTSLGARTDGSSEEIDPNQPDITSDASSNASSLSKASSVWGWFKRHGRR